MAPITIAKYTRPRGVVGQVTGSVATKKAPSIVPPLKQWNSGEPRLDELPPSYAAAARRQTRREDRNRDPPIDDAQRDERDSARQIGRVEPFPIRAAERAESARPGPDVCDGLTAAMFERIERRGRGDGVDCTRIRPDEQMRYAQQDRGVADHRRIEGLLPAPPNACLAIAIATTTAPITITNGTPGGSDSAIRDAVMHALPSRSSPIGD